MATGKVRTNYGRKAAAAGPADPSDDEKTKALHHELLSEKVRGAKLANDRSEAEYNREHSNEGEDHFNRRRAAGTSEAVSKAKGARQKVAHEGEMHQHAVAAASAAHAQKTAIHAHQQRMHQHLEEAAAQKNQHAANSERRAEESHQQSMALKAQQAHALHRAHRRGAAVGIAHALFGGAGGSAKSAMHGQVGGRH